MTTFILDQPAYCAACKRKRNDILFLEDLRLCPDCYLVSTEEILCICKTCGSTSCIKDTELSEIHTDIVLFPVVILEETCNACDS